MNARTCIDCGADISERGAAAKRCRACVRSRRRGLDRERRQRPEYRAQHREYLRRPEVREHLREYNREYKQRPEAKERERERQQSPNMKKRQRERQRKYSQRPEVKEHQREYARRYYRETNRAAQTKYEMRNAEALAREREDQCGQAWIDSMQEPETPYQALVRSEKRAALMAAYLALKERDQQLIRDWMDGVPLHRTATKLDRTRECCRTLRARAIARLQRQLTGKPRKFIAQ